MEIGPLDGSRYETINAMVDTGATFSQIPSSLLRELGIVPARPVESQLADGSIVHDWVGDMRIRIDGREGYSTVLFGEEGSPILMGSYALEGVVLAVDPHNQCLVDLLVSR
jgi:predicted aspartyl protease